MDLKAEIKRKAFHHLSLLYVLGYLVLPRWFMVLLLGFALILLGGVEWLRFRRPELNAWLIKKFGGLHRPSEVMGLSGIFWTLLGAWLTMVIFTSTRIVVPALCFLAFGDSAAALVGRKWGRHPWPKNPLKTYEGSAAFALVSALFGMLFLRWPVALVGGLVVAWIEAQPFRWNDNLLIPVLGGMALSVLNLALGRG